MTEFTTWVDDPPAYLLGLGSTTGQTGDWTGYVRGRLCIRCNSSLPEELNDAASVRAQAEILARYLELTAKRAYSFKYESYKPRKLQPVIVDGEVDLAAF